MFTRFTHDLHRVYIRTEGLLGKTLSSEMCKPCANLEQTKPNSRQTNSYIWTQSAHGKLCFGISEPLCKPIFSKILTSLACFKVPRGESQGMDPCCLLIRDTMGQEAERQRVAWQKLSNATSGGGHRLPTGWLIVCMVVTAVPIKTVSLPWARRLELLSQLKSTLTMS